MGTTAFVAARASSGCSPPATRSRPSTPSRRARPAAATSCAARPCTRRPSGSGWRCARRARLRDAEAQADFAALGADLAVVGAYGLLLPRPVLNAPRLGCINLHASLLPRWRGAAPIERAILAGDAETGITIFQHGGRARIPGPVYAMRPVPIAPATTAPRPARALGGARRRHAAGSSTGSPQARCRPTPQPEEGVTYARKLARERRPARLRRARRLIERRLRALNPAPGCWCEARGERLGLLAGRGRRSAGAPGTIVALPLTVACGDGGLPSPRSSAPASAR